MRENRVLVVEDDRDIRQLIGMILELSGYRCALAGTVTEAKRELERGSFDLMLCDLNLGAENGIVLVREAESAYPGMAVLIVTAEQDPRIARLAAELGAYGYLVKPFKRTELLVHVEHALGASAHERARLLASEERLQADDGRIAVLRSQIETVADSDAAEVEAATLLRLTEAVGLRDIETGAHIRRIGAYAQHLAELAGLPHEDCERIGTAAPTHDVGKIAIPDSILLKPGRLDDAERELMQTHARIGSEILGGTGSALLDLAAEIALTHHERCDGRGYPNGLEDGGIPVPGRIVAIADAFDAMISDRPYRAGMPPERAAAAIASQRGAQFDADLAGLFLEHLDDFTTIAMRTVEGRVNGTGRAKPPGTA